MTSKEMQQFEELMRNLPTLFCMSKKEYDILKRVIGFVMSGEYLPRHKAFCSNEIECTLSCMEVLNFIKANMENVKSFPIILNFPNNLPNPNDNPYLFYNIKSSAWFIGKLSHDRKLYDLYQLNSEFEPEFFMPKFSDEITYYMQVVCRISLETYHTLCTSKYALLNILTMNKLVHIINEQTGMDVYGICSDIDISKHSSIKIKFFYFINTETEVELSCNELILRGGDKFVINLKDEHIPEYVLGCFKKYNIILNENNKYIGQYSIKKENYPYLIAISQKEGIIIGQLKIDNDMKVITRGIICHSGNANIEILSHDFIINESSPLLHFVPSDEQKELYKKFMGSNNRSSMTFSSKLNDHSIHSQTYIKTDDGKVYRIVKDLLNCFICTNYQETVKLPVQEYQKATTEDIFNMLFHSCPEFVKIASINTLFTYDDANDIMYMCIKIPETDTYIKTSIFSEGEWYTETISFDEDPALVNVTKSKTIRAFKSSDNYSWLILISPKSSNKSYIIKLTNNILTKNIYTENDLEGYTEYETDLIKLLKNGIKKFDISKLYCIHAEKNEGFSFLLPVSMTTAYCIIDTENFKLVNIDDLKNYDKVYEFIGHKLKR